MRILPRGGRNFFSRHRCLNLPDVLGPGDPPTTPPHPFEKTLFFNFGAKIQICDAKIQICGAKLQIYGDKSQVHGDKIQIYSAKIQILDPKFKYLKFCTTKNLPLCTRKSPGAAGLTPTHLPIGVFWFLVCYAATQLATQLQ